MLIDRSVHSFRKWNLIGALQLKLEKLLIRRKSTCRTRMSVHVDLDWRRSTETQAGRACCHIRSPGTIEMKPDLIRSRSAGVHITQPPAVLGTKTTRLLWRSDTVGFLEDKAGT